MTSRKLGATSSKSKTIRLRHSCTTEWIGKVNQNLSSAQKQRINATPFKSLMLLPEKVNISGILLEELARRWDKKRGGFRIRSTYVDFTPLDVCYALGLGIVGKNVEFGDDLTSHTLGLVEGKKTSCAGIYEKLTTLSADEHVDDFCRLYILLAMEEFLFPNTYTGIHCGCINLLDDLDSLGTFNWGLAVYQYLVQNLNKVTSSLEESNSPKAYYLSGCVVVLQVWGLEHVWPHHKISPKVDKLFPRCLKWQDVWLFKKTLLDAFEKNQVYDQLNATTEELAFYEVRQALTEAPHGFVSSRQQSADMNNLVVFNQQLEAEHKALEERISKAERDLCDLQNLPHEEKEVLLQTIADLQRQLEEAKNAKNLTPSLSKEAKQGYSPVSSQGNMAEPSSVVVPQNSQHHVSNIYTHKLRNLRIIKSSAAIRTPYETSGVSKKEKNERK